MCQVRVWGVAQLHLVPVERRKRSLGHGMGQILGVRFWEMCCTPGLYPEAVEDLSFQLESLLVRPSVYLELCSPISLWEEAGLPVW